MWVSEWVSEWVCEVLLHWAAYAAKNNTFSQNIAFYSCFLEEYFIQNYKGVFSITPALTNLDFQKLVLVYRTKSLQGSYHLGKTFSIWKGVVGHHRKHMEIFESLFFWTFLVMVSTKACLPETNLSIKTCLHRTNLSK